MILVSGLLLAVLVMAVTYALYLQTRNPGIVDVAWGIAIMLVGSVFLWSGGVQSVTVFYQGLLLLWGCRLSGYLFITRILPGHIDPRYVEIAKQWSKPNLGIALNYLFQAVLVWFVSLTFYPMGETATNLSVIDYFIGALAVISIALESLADWQLKQFRLHSPGEVCNVGLWRYSRHPNYYFEILFWKMMALGVFFHSLSIISFMAPVILFLIMHYLTIPLTEQQSLRSRGEAFRRYQQKTSRLIPWKPMS